MGRKREQPPSSGFFGHEGKLDGQLGLNPSALKGVVGSYPYRVRHFGVSSVGREWPLLKVLPARV
jgi:hypothetical protein